MDCYSSGPSQLTTTGASSLGSAPFDPNILNDNFLIPSVDNIASLAEAMYRHSNGDDSSGEDFCYLDDEDDVFAEGVSTNDENSGGSSGVGSDRQSLLDAAFESVKSQRLTPLLKHELKYFIQSRRLSQGKSEMEVQFLEPAAGQMSPEEVERIQRRKQQNRMAARRFRQKRKYSEEALMQTINQLKQTNLELEKACLQLKNEKEALLNIVATHIFHCPQFQIEQLGDIAGGNIPS